MKKAILKYYLKTTMLFVIILSIIAFSFVPIMPSVLDLMGHSSFLGITFTGETEKSHINVLLMGLDADQTRSDVMMIAQFNFENSSINILQIPRDTYIKNKRSDKKLNSAYGAGGVNKTIEEINTIFDIEIDKYAIVTTSGFRDLIDAVGGIYYDVPQDMNYDDDLQDLHIHLKKGYQLLDGDKAEQYVRCRYIYPTGDLGRIEAQSSFLKEAIAQIISRNKSGGGETRNLIESLGSMMDTNFTLTEMLKYSPYLLNVDTDNVNIMMAKGIAEYRGGGSYFIADKEENKLLIEEYFTPNSETTDLSEVKARDDAIGKASTQYHVSQSPSINKLPSQISVYILDYSQTNSKALARYTERLNELGYNVVGSLVSKTAFCDKTYVISSPKNPSSPKVSLDLGISNYYLNPDYSSDADVILLIGKDI